MFRGKSRDQVEASGTGEKPDGFVRRLRARLNRGNSWLTYDLANLLPAGQIDDATLEELETRLVSADVGLETSSAILDGLRGKVARRELGDIDALLAALKTSMLAILGPVGRPLSIDRTKRPFVILVVGVNGSGKTTTIGKLARRLRDDGLKVMLAAGDTFRAAAIEQLEIWGDRNNVPVIAQAAGADPAAVIFDAMQAAQARGADVLIADTAGRLHTQSNLMDELRKVRRVLGRLDAGGAARGAAGARREPGAERARPGATVPRSARRHRNRAHQARWDGEGWHRARHRRSVAHPDPVPGRGRGRAGLRRVRPGQLRGRGARDPAWSARNRMIRFDHVFKRYPNGREALTDLTLDVGRGEMVFLTGHSGAGKSTLLKLIALIERPTRGNLLVNGQNTTVVPRSKIPAFRRQIGIVFQDHKLLMDRPVYDNVGLPLVIAGVPEKEIGKRVRAALDQVGLLGREHNRPIELSTGEQQRVGIARAVISKPALLIADEPTGNLDPELAVEIMKLFKRFNDVGVTVLIASHDVHLIERFRVRRVMIEGGRVAGGDPAPTLPSMQAN